MTSTGHAVCSVDYSRARMEAMGVGERLQPRATEEESDAAETRIEAGRVG